MTDLYQSLDSSCENSVKTNLLKLAEIIFYRLKPAENIQEKILPSCIKQKIINTQLGKEDYVSRLTSLASEGVVHFYT